MLDEQPAAAAVYAGQEGGIISRTEDTLNWIFISQMECFGEPKVSVTLHESREIYIKRRIDIHFALSSCDRLITHQASASYRSVRGHILNAVPTHTEGYSTHSTKHLTIMTSQKSNLVCSVWSASDGVLGVQALTLFLLGFFFYY